MRKSILILAFLALCSVSCEKEKYVTYTVRVDKEPTADAYMDAEDGKPRRIISGATYTEEMTYKEGYEVVMGVGYSNMRDFPISVKVYDGSQLVTEQSGRKFLTIRFTPQ